MPENSIAYYNSSVINSKESFLIWATLDLLHKWPGKGRQVLQLLSKK